MKNRKEYWEQKERKILVIIFENSREFFINDTYQDSVWKYYDSHFRGKYWLTKSRFEACKAADELPPIYCLDAVTGTKNDAFQIKLAWAKYFCDHDYAPVVGPNMQRIIDDFEPEESLLYQGIKDIPVKKILRADKNLLPDFRRAGKQKRSENSSLKPGVRQLTLRMTEREYMIYAARAEQHGLSLSQYIRECARLGGVLSIDISGLSDYRYDVAKCSNKITGLFQTILLSGNYFPADMAMLQDCCNKICESNGKVDRLITRLCRQLRRMKTGEQINKDPLR